MSIQEKNTNGDSEREKLRSKAFWIAFEMIFVFGIPAAGAVVFSQWLIRQEVLGEWILFVALGLAFILSWIVVILRVRKLSGEFRDIEKKRTHNQPEL